MGFIVNRGLPLDISQAIHYLKLPAFIAIALPFAVRFSTLAQWNLAIPLSCVCFAFVGSVIGIKAQANNGFGMTIIVIFGYYIISFLSTALTTVGMMPIFCQYFGEYGCQICF